jgi:hypothetical protein
VCAKELHLSERDVDRRDALAGEIAKLFGDIYAGQAYEGFTTYLRSPGSSIKPVNFLRA